MDRKKMSIAVASAAITLFAVSCVTAASLMPSTPLYAVRMEQLSSKMNFLPTAVNGFTYSAQEGYELNCGFTTCGGVTPLDIEPTNAQHLCEWTVETCPYTCLHTCPDTCSTCSTCLIETCPVTCQYTCGSGGTCDPPC